MSGRAKALSLTFVRMSLGLIALMHGLANTFGLFGGPGLDAFATEVAARVSVAPALTTYVIAFGQLLMGLSLLLGPLAKLAAILAVVFAVANVLFAARYTAFFVDNGGFEFMLALCAMGVVIAVHGPGMFCIELKSKGKD